MSKRYSIAEARDGLASIVHEAEEGGAVELTRRGRPVAVIVSIEEYHRRSPGRPTFAEALDRFLRKVREGAVSLPADVFEGLRDHTPGREPPV